MYRIVLDANVFVSAVASDGRARQLVVKTLDEKRCAVISTPAINAEVRKVLRRSKLKTRRSEHKKFRLRLSACETVNPEFGFKAVERDHDDDIIIDAAYHGRVDYIVSGDHHLLDMKEFRGIPIITIVQMLDLLEA